MVGKRIGSLCLRMGGLGSYRASSSPTVNKSEPKDRTASMCTSTFSARKAGIDIYFVSLCDSWIKNMLCLAANADTAGQRHANDTTPLRP